MKKIAAAVITALTGAVLTISPAAHGDAEPAGGRGHYADVNGLRMYYEVHGKDRGKPPVVLIHGAFSATGTSWDELIGGIAKTRKVISVEQQGHGHTADIVNRPLRLDQMAKDTADLLGKIGVRKADVWGYSMGAGVAMQMAVHHPDKVNKLVFMSATINNTGFHPGHLEMMDQIQPENLYGTPFHDEYKRINPRPENFDLLVTKIKDMVRATPAVPDNAIKALRAPVLTIIGDSDIVRPEHAVELFRLTGGGVNGDIAGLPSSELAVLPGTTHITTAHHQALTTLVPTFLDRPAA
ncbi:alpha/beta fold hydrolase [Kibdelosporangium phytohabitans]|uniref:Alpha/beta hydrolase n=1 Tax=Kibdelosporangium phytohabitans TaxID=860235 RepID=A0A0N7F2G1_9PSEU|nr:alpha/beta hydrolase [Kibdelosporangium phytohabitans]ALG05735.1 alpha/beta hydrolase [Kibdelosporangium phytohabitans]MBE1466272.1 pimeloyl-ACP methyl ester carboxylesterase [Kibdelosporangium phytohabitans]